jgi:hypothetical protein
MAAPKKLKRPAAGSRYDPTAIDATGATLGDVLTAVSDGSGGQRAGYAATGVSVAIPATLIDAKGDLIVGTADDTVARLPVGANGAIPIGDTSQTTGIKWAPAPFAAIAEFGDGVTVPGVGSIAIITVPAAGTIIQSDIDADASGSAVVNWYRAAAGTPTTFSSIVASAKPTLSSGQSATDSTLTGWTTGIAAGDRLKAVLESVATCKLVSNALTFRRT